MVYKIDGKVIPGYGVASGKGKDPRYPAGTLSMQLSYFKEKGLDLNNYYLGTLNVDISPKKFSLKTPTYYFENIDWSSHIPPENFYFFEVTLLFKNIKYEGLIYMPDPKTKVDHEQLSTVLELILPKIEGLVTGTKVSLEIKEECLLITENI